jgi:hypothetical protein
MKRGSVVLCTLQKHTRVIYIARNLFHGMCKGIRWALRCFEVSGFRVRALRAPTLLLGVAVVSGIGTITGGS